ncbi:MAG: hypothetical protein HY873_02045 [Chloroflexi bacterium]|nr:hypothetical protein [Chloroflexota bacterium]
MQGVFHVLAAALRTASRPITLALERMGRLLAFVRDFIADFAGDITFMKMLIISAVAAGLALGVGSAVIFIRGDDEAPSAIAPTPTATGDLTPAPTKPVRAPTTAGTSTRAAPSNVITVRGELDVSSMTATGLSIPEHSVELLLFTDTGAVSGSMVIALDAFPIGQLLAGTFDALDDPEWAQFKACTVRLTLDGAVTGTYDPATGAIQGETRVTPVTDDVASCLDTRPPNVTLDDAVESSTFTWSATFDGRTATGITQLDPPTPFSATVVD